VKDQQHGFGVQRWASGAAYCGQWDRNKESGWGAYFSPCNPHTQHNPHSGQMLYLGTFRRGCPKEGIVIECNDFRKLKAENFSLEQCEAAAKEIYPQLFRVYHVSYDGVSAFWQLPVPNKKKGLFDLKIRLCEYEWSKANRPLEHKKTLEEVWYKWIPKPIPQGTEQKEKKQLKTKSEGGAGNDKSAEADMPDSNRTVQKESTYETLYYHGMCVRDTTGNFPCPTDGTLSIFPETRGTGINPPDDSRVEYVAKFNPGSSISPALQFIAGSVKYAVPANDCELCLFLGLER
jgi:hypothetical protein